MLDIELVGEDAKPDNPLKKLVQRAAPRQNLPVGTVAYTLATIDEGEEKLAYISGTLYKYTRYNDTLYRVAWTAA